MNEWVLRELKVVTAEAADATNHSPPFYRCPGTNGLEGWEKGEGTGDCGALWAWTGKGGRKEKCMGGELENTPYARRIYDC